MESTIRRARGWSHTSDPVRDDIYRSELSDGNVGSWPLRLPALLLFQGIAREDCTSRLLKKASRSVSKSSLWFSVRSLCLCGECFSAQFHHRDTENHRDCTEKNIDPSLTTTFSAAC